MANDLVRTRKYVKKFMLMRTNIQAVSLRIQVFSFYMFPVIPSCFFKKYFWLNDTTLLYNICSCTFLSLNLDSSFIKSNGSSNERSCKGTVYTFYCYLVYIISNP